MTVTSFEGQFPIKPLRARALRHAFWTLVVLVLAAAGSSALCAQDEPKDSRAATTSSKSVFVFPVMGELDSSNCERIQADVTALIDKHGFRNFVFEIDTPGGEVVAVKRLAAFIDGLREVNTIAYIPSAKWAYSGGTLLAFACDHLEMGENSRIGAAAPGMVGEGWQELPEKFQAVIRQDFVTYSRDRFPLRLVEAMVTPGPRIYRVKLGTAPDAETKYLTEDELETNQARILSKEPVLDPGKLLVLDEKQALLNGFIDRVFPTLNDLLEHYLLLEGVWTPEDFRIHGNFAGSMHDWTSWFLGNDWVRFALILFGVLGVVLEVKFPGTTLPGAAGLGCFIFFFVGAFLGGTAGWIEIAVFGAGLLLLAVEIFFLPGFGVPGFTGLILLIAGLVMALVGPTTGDAPLPGIASALVIVLGGFAVSVIATLTVLHFLPQPESIGASGLISHAVLGVDPGPTRLLARTGKVVSPLRPAGKIDIDGELIDATSAGEFIENGVLVEVFDIKGNRVVVRQTGGPA